MGMGATWPEIPLLLPEELKPADELKAPEEEPEAKFPKFLIGGRRGVAGGP